MDITAKEDLLTGFCDNRQTFPRHHVLAPCSVYTSEIAVRNTWNKEYIRR